MSAVEALAEVLASHRLHVGTLRPTTCSCGEWVPYEPTHDQHVAAALVAAIRSMPAEQVAELIGGDVEAGVMAEVGGGVLPPHRWDNPQRVDMVQVQRPVGPWLPLGVSPETNGEQK